MKSKTNTYAMSTKTDNIQALTESITKSLRDIVSLKQTCELHKDTIESLNKKNSEINLELTNSKIENARLNEEIESQKDMITILGDERKELALVIEKLEKIKSSNKKTVVQG